MLSQKQALAANAESVASLGRSESLPFGAKVVYKGSPSMLVVRREDRSVTLPPTYPTGLYKWVEETWKDWVETAQQDRIIVFGVWVSRLDLYVVYGAVFDEEGVYDPAELEARLPDLDKLIVAPWAMEPKVFTHAPSVETYIRHAQRKLKDGGTGLVDVIRDDFGFDMMADLVMLPVHNRPIEIDTDLGLAA